MPTIIQETVTIDGQKLTRHIDANESKHIGRYIASEKKMNEIGIRLDSYAARVEKGRKGPMSGAIQAQNQKGGMSSNQRRAVKAEKEQGKLNRTARFM